MHCRIVDLRCKEVINLDDGSRLGFVNDVEIDVSCGRVVAIVVPRRTSVFLKGNDLVIPWDCVKRIGDDIILVEINVPAAFRHTDKRTGWCL